MKSFYKIATTSGKRKGEITVYPKFLVRDCDNLMTKGNDFYAVYNDETGLWTKNQDAVTEMIDRDIWKEVERLKEKSTDTIIPALMSDADSKSMYKFKQLVKKLLQDHYKSLDSKVIYRSQDTKLEDYATKRLPYDLNDGSTAAYDELIGTLYSPEEKAKIEWAIGAVLSGDAKHIQKFIVFYGSAGTGKSTALNIIQQLFEGYYSTFDAKSLGMGDSSFSMEPFKNNPLVTIQHDGDLSRIEDNTRLNSIVSHEEMVINEKHKSLYTAKFETFLFLGTNRPVKITEAKSGLTRRLIDVQPTGLMVPYSRYKMLMEQIKFELGSIAKHCLDIYRSMGEDYYESYKPNEMMSATNHFYSFVEDNYEFFAAEDKAELKTVWRMYKEYVADAMIHYPMNMQTVKEECKNYFREWKDRGYNNQGARVRNLYSGFITEKFNYDFKAEKDNSMTYSWLRFDGKRNIFDEMCSEYPAQLASSKGTPMKKWANVVTKLSDIDTSKLHYVKILDLHHIVIDFDLKDENGEKSLELNMKAASRWPKTYAELSKSGQGIHLHYIYAGDPEKLERIYDEDIEIKVFTGDTSLRRMVTDFNELPIATIDSGLPLKGDDRVVNFEGMKNEKAIRTLIQNCLDKKHHGATAPEVDLIYATLDKAYSDGLHYDVRDLRPKVLAFANNSTHQADKCVKLVSKMKFNSDDISDHVEAENPLLIFFDVEVFPNLFVICYKSEGKETVKLINPTVAEVEELVRFNLVGFNNRRYDNHILYGKLLGYSNKELYDLSQRIINGSKNAMFGEAYNLSYTDIYDFSSKKQSLKKWEIALDIHHQELGLKWDEPVPEDKWKLVADYCVNDVIATEAVWNHLQADFIGREILADIAGMSVNDSTNSLTTRIIFGKEKHPKLVYTDLATGKSSDGTYLEKNKFEGYEYRDGHNIFMGEDVGRGGYVYAEPGMYGNVALLDIQSMHPNSIINMNCFGEYTQNFADILNARLAIKHKNYDAAGKMLNGKLKPYLKDKSKAKALSYALKIAINSVYGLTSANFDNPFKDDRNANNIVALRGALFMVLLKHEVQKRGYIVAHIKTDSIKIPDADRKIIDFCMDFGKKYGYIFEHEATYDRMCLVNDAVYIARYSTPDICNDLYGYVPGDFLDDADIAGKWTATGAQFAVPYVKKTMFSKEPLVFKDMCETKAVKTAIYLDMNEDLPQLTPDEDRELAYLDKVQHSEEPEKVKIPKKYQYEPEEFGRRYSELCKKNEKSHDYYYVGRVGEFCPILPGRGGGLLVRESDTGYSSVGGTKGYRWMSSEMVKELHKEDDIDRSYYNRLVDEAIASISEYGDFEWFISEEAYNGELDCRVPFDVDAKGE